MLSRYYIAEPTQKHRTSPSLATVLSAKAVARRSSAHIRAYRSIFYCTNSSCISICSMLSFFVLIWTPFEIFDPTFPGAALPAPVPIASWLLQTQRQLFAISISNRIIDLHTLHSLFCRLLQAKPFPFFALRTLAKKTGGCTPPRPFQKPASCVFNNIRGYAASVATRTPTRLQRFRNAVRCKVSRNASVPPCRVVDRAPVRLPKRRQASSDAPRIY